MFGAMFNEIYIVRSGASSASANQIRVPIHYSPKSKLIARINEVVDPDTDTKIAAKLPRMSFEITNIAYDPERQLLPGNKLCLPGETTGSRGQVLAGSPYVVTFDLNIYARTHEDAHQIVEQIFPYFKPTYSLSIKPFADNPTFSEDVTTTLNGVSFSDDYEGAQENRRTIIYTLSFDMKVNFYGPVNDAKIIRRVETHLHSGMTDSDYYGTCITVPDPIDVSPDSDYGFTETFTPITDSDLR